MIKSHSFHIPVMGIGFTVDTPLKVSQYGIDSVISLVDDILLEKLRKMYLKKYEIPYQEISEKIETPKTAEPVKETQRKSLKDRYKESRKE